MHIASSEKHLLLKRTESFLIQICRFDELTEHTDASHRCESWMWHSTVLQASQFESCLNFKCFWMDFLTEINSISDYFYLAMWTVSWTVQRQCITLSVTVWIMLCVLKKKDNFGCQPDQVWTICRFLNIGTGCNLTLFDDASLLSRERERVSLHLTYYSLRIGIRLTFNLLNLTTKHPLLWQILKSSQIL